MSIKQVYFIADARRACVKIGISVNPGARLYDLQAGNHTTLRLELALTFDENGGAEQYEDALHQQFAQFWRHREWFTFAPPVKDFVASWKRGEVPVVIWPTHSCRMAVGDYGARLTKEEYLTRLRAIARCQK